MMEAARALRPVILVCDDELPLRELIKAVLGDAFDVLEAADAAQAEALLDRTRVDAVVLDVMLPGKSGLELLAELRGRPSSATTPVVVVSAWQSDADRRAASDAGADAFVGKPFDPDELVRVVESVTRT
jgi:two-component system, OmpR family, phosphate regulon response regulator PhoB